jgi:hypothetical protein
MTERIAPRRPGPLSILMIVTSVGASIAISVAMDVVLLRYMTAARPDVYVSIALFNATCVLQSAVGGIIEWRRPGHLIGRLLMLSGPLYGLVAAGWLTAAPLKPVVDPKVYQVVSWAGALLSYPAVALIGGWVPLLFPTGALPGPRWRAPVALLIVLSGIGLVSWAVRPGPLAPNEDFFSPIAFDAWPSFLQPFVDAIPLEMVALLALAAAAMITRYRRGDHIERLQIRWLVSAVTVCAAGFAATVADFALRTSEGAPVSRPTTLIAYAGILAMPIAIGIAVLRYRLYEIDRLISRTIGWATVTGVIVAVFAGMVVGLQAVLANVTQGGTLAVAASTLVAFALFQPIRRRVQTIVDRRFDRARYDGDRTAAAFGERLRDRVDIAGLEADIAGVVDDALRPTSVGVWIRGADPTTASTR